MPRDLLTSLTLLHLSHLAISDVLTSAFAAQSWVPVFRKLRCRIPRRGADDATTSTSPSTTDFLIINWNPLALYFPFLPHATQHPQFICFRTLVPYPAAKGQLPFSILSIFILRPALIIASIPLLIEGENTACRPRTPNRTPNGTCSIKANLL